MRVCELLPRGVDPVQELSLAQRCIDEAASPDMARELLEPVAGRSPPAQLSGPAGEGREVRDEESNTDWAEELLDPASGGPEAAALVQAAAEALLGAPPPRAPVLVPGEDQYWQGTPPDTSADGDSTPQPEVHDATEGDGDGGAGASEQGAKADSGTPASGPEYELRCVVRHVGSNAWLGHYNTHALGAVHLGVGAARQDKTWRCFDDDSVRELAEGSVLNEDSQRKAYILLYVLKESLHADEPAPAAGDESDSDEVILLE